MTIEEIKQLNKDFGKPTELWKRAFEEHNNQNPLSHKYSMNCRSCWYKVFKWHEDRITQGK